MIRFWALFAESVMCLVLWIIYEAIMQLLIYNSEIRYDRLSRLVFVRFSIFNYMVWSRGRLLIFNLIRTWIGGLTQFEAFSSFGAMVLLPAWRIKLFHYCFKGREVISYFSTHFFFIPIEKITFLILFNY